MCRKKSTVYSRLRLVKSNNFSIDVIKRELAAIVWAHPNIWTYQEKRYRNMRAHAYKSRSEKLIYRVATNLILCRTLLRIHSYHIHINEPIVALRWPHRQFQSHKLIGNSFSLNACAVPDLSTHSNSFIFIFKYSHNLRCHCLSFCVIHRPSLFRSSQFTFFYPRFP